MPTGHDPVTHYIGTARAFLQWIPGPRERRGPRHQVLAPCMSSMPDMRAAVSVSLLLLYYTCDSEPGLGPFLIRSSILVHVWLSSVYIKLALLCCTS